MVRGNEKGLTPNGRQETFFWKVLIGKCFYRLFVGGKSPAGGIYQKGAPPAASQCAMSVNYSQGSRRNPRSESQGAYRIILIIKIAFELLGTHVAGGCKPCFLTLVAVPATLEWKCVRCPRI